MIRQGNVQVKVMWRLHPEIPLYTLKLQPPGIGLCPSSMEETDQRDKVQLRVDNEQVKSARSTADMVSGGAITRCSHVRRVVARR